MSFGKFINEESQVRFQAQYAPLVDEIFHLQKLYNENEKDAIGSTLDLNAKVIHFLMNTIWDDFMEILLLFANNYPLGARKILRAMFESTTHILAFAREPDEIDKFVEFAWIDEGKLVALDSTYYTADAIEEIEKRAAEVKKRFQQPVCEYCKIAGCQDCAKTRTAATWMGKVDIVSLAKKNGMPTDIIRNAYYLPLHETHPKFHSIMLRQKDLDDGTMEYHHDIDSDPDDRTLLSAHYLVVTSLSVFFEYFKVSSLETILTGPVKRFGEIWKTIYHKPDEGVEGRC